MKKLLMFFAISASLASITASCKQSEYRPEVKVVSDSVKVQSLNDTISIDSVSLKAYHSGINLPEVNSREIDLVVQAVNVADNKQAYVKSVKTPIVVYCITRPEPDKVAALVSTRSNSYLVYGVGNNYHTVETPDLIFGCPTIIWKS